MTDPIPPRTVGLTTAVSRAVLSPTPGGGSAGLVAQRLAEAIRLGILLDGERLPPEIRLAEQLGVATVTLREALTVLRGQGLVTTRRGRGGGTFVSAPDLGDSLARRLRDLTTLQIRELGDHRGAVAIAAARLAARRAAPSEVTDLEAQVDRLRTARTPSDRRRAALQFSLMVTAAAHSPRLLREEHRLSAEVGDLLWLEVGDDEHTAAVRVRARLAEAIRAGDVPGAAALAEQQVLDETARLVGLRLRAYATDRAHPSDRSHLTDRTHPTDRSHSTGRDRDAELPAVFARVFATLETFAEAFHDLARTAESLRTGDLAALRPMITEALSANPGLVTGAGVIPAPNLLADSPLWLEWWWTTPAGTPELLRVNLDAAAPDFYDYTTAGWFASVRDNGRPDVTGPYLDHFCTGQYTLTFSVPILLDGRFLGAAAADVLIENLEPLVMPALLAEDHPAALVSPDGRIIAATTPLWPDDLREPVDGAPLPPPLQQWHLKALG